MANGDATAGGAGGQGAAGDADGGAPVPYLTDEANRPQWTERADALWRDGTLHVDLVSPRGVRALQVAGPCPHCEHELSARRILRAVVSETEGVGRRHLKLGADLATRGREQRRERWARLVVSCNCDHEHPGRPDGVTQGCGANFALAVPLQP